MSSLRQKIADEQLELARRRLQAYFRLEEMLGREGIHKVLGLNPERLYAALMERVSQWSQVR